MVEAYTIGVRLALEDGVSAGISSIRRDLAALDRAVGTSTGQVLKLSRLGRQVVLPGEPLVSVETARKAPSPRSPERRPEKTEDQSEGAPTVMRSPLGAAAPEPKVQDGTRCTEAQTAQAPRVPTSVSISEKEIPVRAVGFLPAPVAPCSPLVPNLPVPPAEARNAAPDLCSFAQLVSPPVSPFPGQGAEPTRVTPVPLGPALPNLPSGQAQSPSAPVADEVVGPNTAVASAALGSLTAPMLTTVGGRPLMAPAQFERLSLVPRPSPNPAALEEGNERYQPALSANPAMPSGARDFEKPEQPSRVSADQGDLILDGMRLGRWISDRLSERITRPQQGFTGIDPRLSPSWPGPVTGA